MPGDPPTDDVAGLRAMVGHAPLNLMGAVGLVLDGEGRVLLQKLAGRDVWGQPGGHQVSFYTAVYRVTEWSGVPVPDGVEGTELRFFAPDDLPLPLQGQPGAWAADWLSRVP